MRRLLWFTLGFGAACAFCTYGRQPLLLMLPLTVLLFAVLTEGKRKTKCLLSVFGIVMGLSWFSWFETQILKPVYVLDGRTQEADIRCDTFPEQTDYGCRTEGTIRIGDRDYKVLCYLKPGEDVSPGLILSGTFRFRVAAPGGEADSGYYQGEKIFLLAYPEGKLTITRGEGNWRDNAAQLRRKILMLLENTLPTDAAMFSKALLLGDSSDLDYETKTNFTVSGIRHIVAVSGLHVSILFSLVYHFSFRRRLLSAMLMFPVLLVFAAMTGFTASVSRACIMSGLMLLATLVNREYDGPVSLSFAGLLLLLMNPLVIASAGFQLSFASVAGIFLFSTQIRSWLSALLQGKVPVGFARYLAASVSVTLGASVLTVPLGALHFGTVSLLAPVTNLLVLWVVSIIFYGLTLLCLLYGLWPAVTAVLGQLLTVLIRYVLVVGKLLAAFPLSAVYTCSPYITIWLVFVYLVLGLYRIRSNRYPATLCCSILLSLCMALLVSWTEPVLDSTRLTVLDVGQGQCLLLESEGKAFLVDCGGSTDAMAADAAAETLLSHGITRLDCLMVTHSDRDHAGGVKELLTRVDAELLILPPVPAEETYPARETVYASGELLLSAGSTEIRIFPSEITGNSNENSLCILFDTKSCDILITGDRSWFGEQILLQHYAIPKVDVLIAGHHGSKHATGEVLLEAACPEIVCISAGRDNAFGHPAPELLERLENFGCTVYRTDMQGDIIIRR